MECLGLWGLVMKDGDVIYHVSVVGIISVIAWCTDETKG